MTERIKKGWYSIGGYCYHVCENCPDAPFFPYSRLDMDEGVRKGTGGKRICGKCLDLIGKKRCKKPTREGEVR